MMFLHSPVVAIAVLMLFPVTVQAASIKSPIVNKGEAEIELQGNLDSGGDSAKDGGYELKTGVGYGVTDHWFVKIKSEWEREAQERLRHKAVALENRFQILPQGEYILDLGFYAEYELTTQADAAEEITFGPILRSDVGNWRLTANPFVAVEVGAHSEKPPEFKYGLQGLYLFQLIAAFGIEAYGTVADKPQDEQKHQVGPVVTGKISAKNLGLLGKFGYEVGALFGLTTAAADQTYRFKLEYEWAW
jgi:hypothetical protein